MTENLNDVFKNLPEVKAGIGVWQNKFHEFDVFTHTEKFVKYLSGMTSDRNIIAAGWLHDIGKPATAIIKKDSRGKILKNELGKTYHEFENHEIVGGKMVRKINPEIFKKLGLDQEKIAKLVGCHYIPMKGIKGLRKTKNFKDFTIHFNILDKQLSILDVTKEEVLTMFLADKLAQGKSCADKDELFLIREILLKTNRTESDLKKIYNMQKLHIGKK